ncbi:MAG: dGTP triphosphohydrolase [Hyphomicrobiaceae bacterium]
MDWAKLLSKDRYYQGSAPPPTATGPVYVNAFQEDISRIVYSSAFRRLQGKTQVHPFPKLDYLRTRLTHTFEVANVGRQIGTAVGRHIDSLGLLPKDFHVSDIGDIVTGACLAHDLGNPPFGHIGEYAIQSWFEEHKNEDYIKLVFSDKDIENDFKCFDGNAQGFRLLTRLQGWRYRGGLQLTYAVLGAFSKYPFNSRKEIEKKKYGFMHNDEAAAKNIFSALGMIERSKQDGDTLHRILEFSRHPLSFVSEAADDICYLTTDIEDGVRADILDFADVEELLLSIAKTRHHAPRYHEIPDDRLQDRVAYLRAGAISALIDDVINEFRDKYDEIMKGNFRRSLLESGHLSRDCNQIRQYCKDHLYFEREKMEKEAAGYCVIFGLMDAFGTMLMELLRKNGEIGKLNMRYQNLYHLLPTSDGASVGQDPYSTLLFLVDYISGMTDRYALELFQKITGSSASLGRMA